MLCSSWLGVCAQLCPACRRGPAGRGSGAGCPLCLMGPLFLPPGAVLRLRRCPVAWLCCGESRTRDGNSEVTFWPLGGMGCGAFLFFFSTYFFFFVAILSTYVVCCWCCYWRGYCLGQTQFDGLTSLACPDLGHFAGTVTLSSSPFSSPAQPGHLGPATALRLSASKYTASQRTRIIHGCPVSSPLRPLTLKRRGRRVIQGLPAPFHFGV